MCSSQARCWLDTALWTARGRPRCEHSRSMFPVAQSLRCSGQKFYFSRLQSTSPMTLARCVAESYRGSALHCRRCNCSKGRWRRHHPCSVGEICSTVGFMGVELPLLAHCAALHREDEADPLSSPGPTSSPSGKRSSMSAQTKLELHYLELRTRLFPALTDMISTVCSMPSCTAAEKHDLLHHIAPLIEDVACCLQPKWRYTRHKFLSSRSSTQSFVKGCRLMYCVHKAIHAAVASTHSTSTNNKAHEGVPPFSSQQNHALGDDELLFTPQLEQPTPVPSLAAGISLTCAKLLEDTFERLVSDEFPVTWEEIPNDTVERGKLFCSGACHAREHSALCRSATAALFIVTHCCAANTPTTRTDGGRNIERCQKLQPSHRRDILDRCFALQNGSLRWMLVLR